MLHDGRNRVILTDFDGRVLATHILSEVPAVGDRVVLDDGGILWYVHSRRFDLSNEFNRRWYVRMER